MRGMKFRFIAVMMCGWFFSTPAQAGIPVIDVSNLMQSIMEVLNSVEQISNQVSQIQNQVEQIERAQQTLDSMTGSRNLGNILNNPAFHTYLPPNAIDTYNALVDGYDALNGAARTMRDAEMLYNCLDKPAGPARRRCQATLARPYQQKAFMQQAIQTSNSRIAQINSLMQQINTTTDPKAIGELQARIDAENAMLLNEMARAQYLQGLYDADARAEENRQEEIRMEALTRTGTVMDEVPQP